MGLVSNFFGKGLPAILPTNKSFSPQSPSGVVYTVSRMLGSSSNLSLVSGSDSNLTINGTTGAISATSAIPQGTSQTAIVREALGALAAEFPVVITAAGNVVLSPAVFSSAPSITHDGSPSAGEIITGVDGVLSVGNITGRQWFLAGQPISGGTNPALTTSQDGSYTFQNTAVGPNGVPITSMSNPVSVAVYQGTAPALLGLHSRIVFEGDSQFASSANVQGYPTYIPAFTAGRFRMANGYNQATGGQSSAQMVTQTASVNAVNPDVVVLIAGGNDPKNNDTDRDTIIANIQTMIAAYLSGTARYVVVCTTPNFTTLTSTARSVLLQVNTAIRAMATSSIKVVDLEAIITPATDTIDGTVPNQRGSILGGQAIAAVLNSISDGSSPLALYNDASNVLLARGKDPTFSTGGGNINNTGTGTINGVTSGTDAAIPLGWSVNNPTSLPITVTRVDRGDGTFGVRIQTSGSTPIAAGRISLSTSGTRAAPVVIGQTNEQWVGFAQAADMQGVSVLDMVSSSSYDFTPGRSQDSGYATGPGLPAVTGVMRTGQIGSYTSALTSFNQINEIYVQPGIETKFDITFFKPYTTLVDTSAGAAGGTTVPDAPSLSAASSQVNQVTIAFTDGSNGGATITAHPVYRSTTAGFIADSSNLIATYTGTSPYLDTTGTPGTQYYYKMKATNSVGDSIGVSNETTGTPQIAGQGPIMTTFAYDNFGGTPATNLSGRTTDSGTTWATFDSASAVSFQLSTGGDVWQTNTGANARMSLAAPNADVEVSMTLRVLSLITNQTLGVTARASGTTSGTYTYYFTDYNMASGVVRLGKKVNGTTTTLLSTNIGVATVGDHVLKLTVIGDTLTSYMDGVQVSTITDTAITAAGWVGIKSGGAATTDTTGTHADNYVAKS